MADASVREAKYALMESCPTSAYHETHRYCPSCPWTEEYGDAEFIRTRAALGENCACVVEDDPDDGSPGGWVPCPPNLCERPDHEHAHEPHPRVIEPTIRALVQHAKEVGLLYIHDEDEQVVALVIPKGGWWDENLPAVPPEGDPGFERAFAHDHVSLDGLVP